MTENVYKIVIDDDCGMDAIALVHDPAIERNFLTFSNSPKMVIKMSDDEKHLLSGPVCLADTPIYRYSPDMGEYYIVFEKDTIERMVHRYMKENLGNSVNLEHNSDKSTLACTMVESYIKDTPRGICPAEFKDVPDGSWFATFKVEDDEIWNAVKAGDFKGFSLEGYFGLEEKMKSAKRTDETEQTYEEYLKSLLS